MYPVWMSFATLPLHPLLLKGLKDLGFVRPTPIQADAIPPALAGRDVLACAMTGSGKTVAFLLPILQQLMTRPRGMTRALVVTPTRELAAQILEATQRRSPSTRRSPARRCTAASAMGPQDTPSAPAPTCIIATPGRLLDHFRQPYAKLTGSSISCSTRPIGCWTWDSCPTSGACFGTCPTRRQTLFFSATMPPPIAALTRELLRNPVTINLRAPVRAGGRHHAGRLSRRAAPQVAAAAGAAAHRRDAGGAGVHADEASGQSAGRVPRRAGDCRRTHSRQPLQARRTEALEGFKWGVPGARRDRHRGARDRRRSARPRRQLRRARGPRRLHPPRRPNGPRGSDGRCFTFVSPEEETDLQASRRPWASVCRA